MARGATSTRITAQDRRGLRRFMRAVVRKMKERGLEENVGPLPAGVLAEVVAEFGGTAQAQRFRRITEQYLSDDDAA